MPYLGHVGRVEHARETTYGSAVTCDAALAVISCDLHRVVPNEVAPILAQGLASLAPTEEFRTADRVEGSIVCPANCEGLGRFLEQAFRKDVTDGGTGPSSYTHIYMLGLGATKPSLSLNKVWYDTGTAGEKAEKYEGCYIPSWTFEVRTGSFAQWTFNIVGETSGGETTPIGTGSAPLTTSPTALYFNQAGAVTWGSAIGLVRSFRVTCDHSMPVRMGLGSLNPKAPYPTGRASVLVDLEVDWDSSLFNAGLSARTQQDLTVTFTSGTRSYAWQLESATVQSASSPVDAVGILMQRVQLRAFTDLTTEGVKLTITNSTSSGVAG